MRSLVALAVLLGVAIAPGCGASGDCTEKATCPDPGDAGGQVGEGGKDAAGGADANGDGPSSDASSDVSPSTDSPSTCGGVCADPVPAGWSGPVTLFDQTGPPAPAAPACPTSFPTDAYDGHADLDAPGPSCTCTCAGGTGAQCGSSSIVFYTDGACQNGCDGSLGLPPGLCVTTGCASSPGSFVLTAPPVAFAGSCAPNATSNVPPWTWSTTARACGTTAVTGSCSGSSLCVPTPPAPFAKVCVFQAGMASCPAGAYSIGHLYYGGVSDSRACSGCSCGSPTGVSCSGAVVEGFSMNTGTCGGTEVTFGSLSGCQMLGVTVAGEEETTAPTAANGTCTATGGQASGTATVATPTTVCCTP